MLFRNEKEKKLKKNNHTNLLFKYDSVRLEEKNNKAVTSRNSSE